MTVSGIGVRDHFAITNDQIRADDDPNVVHLQTLAGVNASHLLNGLLSNDPKAAVLIEVPLAFVVTNDDWSVEGALCLPVDKSNGCSASRPKADSHTVPDIRCSQTSTYRKESLANSNLFPPADLARYIALSALLKIFPTSACTPWNRAMPRLAGH